LQLRTKRPFSLRLSAHAVSVSAVKWSSWFSPGGSEGRAKGSKKGNSPYGRQKMKRSQVDGSGVRQTASLARKRRGFREATSFG
jgi:hypothetical protein